MEVPEAGHEIKHFGFRRVVTGVIFFGCADNDINDVRETTATAAPFFHSVVDFCRHDQLPTVLIKKAVDNFADIHIRYVVAAADKHVIIPNMTITIAFCAKEDGGCQEKFTDEICTAARLQTQLPARLIPILAFNEIG
jgi:hypothetical protein